METLCCPATQQCLSAPFSEGLSSVSRTGFQLQNPAGPAAGQADASTSGTGNALTHPEFPFRLDSGPGLSPDPELTEAQGTPSPGEAMPGCAGWGSRSGDGEATSGPPVTPHWCCQGLSGPATAPVREALWTPGVGTRSPPGRSHSFRPGPAGEGFVMTTRWGSRSSRKI